MFNVALLGKWLWRFVEENTRLWKRVVVVKFGEGRGGWCSRRVGQSHGLGLWKGIWLRWEEFWRRVKLKVGVGDRVRFWLDRWYGALSLEVRFPLIFGIAADMEVRVGAVRSRHSAGILLFGMCICTAMYRIGSQISYWSCWVFYMLCVLKRLSRIL